MKTITYFKPKLNGCLWEAEKGKALADQLVDNINNNETIVNVTPKLMTIFGLLPDFINIKSRENADELEFIGYYRSLFFNLVFSPKKDVEFLSYKTLNGEYEIVVDMSDFMPNLKNSL